MLGFVGAAVDYTRANAARSSMQAALDSAVLMVSKDAAANPTMTSQQITDAVQRYFSSLYHDPDAVADPVNATYTPSTSSASATILATGHGSIQTDFMKVVGFPQLNFGTSSTSTWGNSRMRVALVLDNTGSMAQNGKMSALQSAAKDMIDSLSAFSKTSGDVYISIVPFSKDVNTDSSNYNASWINWTDWEAEPPYLNDTKGTTHYPSNWQYIGPGSSCPFSSSSYGFSCTSGPASLGGSSTSTIPSSGLICPSLDNGRKIPGRTGSYYNGCYTSTGATTVISSGTNASCGNASNCSCSGNGKNRTCSQTTYTHTWRGSTTAAPAHNTWNGCIADRDQNYDTTNAAYVVGDSQPSTRYYADQSTYCPPATITAMSNQWSTLKAQIDTMSPNGNTDQAVGLAWGWQSLNTTNGPIMAPAKDSTHIYQDYIVLLSDGLNTQNRWYTNASSIDARQELLCQNVKDSGVKIFTIQVNINSQDPMSQVLQDCASDGNFQMITSATQTADAFQNILTQISQLRIAK